MCHITQAYVRACVCSSVLHELHFFDRGVWMRFAPFCCSVHSKNERIDSWLIRGGVAVVLCCVCGRGKKFHTSHSVFFSTSNVLIHFKFLFSKTANATVTHAQMFCTSNTFIRPYTCARNKRMNWSNGVKYLMIWEWDTIMRCITVLFSTNWFCCCLILDYTL